MIRRPQPTASCGQCGRPCVLVHDRRRRRIRERDGFDRRVWLNVPIRRLDWQREGYGGPCPPSGRHRYVHKLYALDTVLPVLKPATKAALERALQGHILAKAELVGYYEKRK